jgi:hypothetical protein
MDGHASEIAWAKAEVIGMTDDQLIEYLEKRYSGKMTMPGGKLNMETVRKICVTVMAASYD